VCCKYLFLSLHLLFSVVVDTKRNLKSSIQGACNYFWNETISNFQFSNCALNKQFQLGVNLMVWWWKISKLAYNTELQVSSHAWRVVEYVHFEQVESRPTLAIFGFGNSSTKPSWMLSMGTWPPHCVQWSMMDVCHPTSSCHLPAPPYPHASQLICLAPLPWVSIRRYLF
jgi:hypothetical protein